MEATQRWYRKKDLCRIFSVSRACIDRWERDENYAHLGFPKSRKLPGTEIVIWLSAEIDTWAQERERKAPRK